MQEPPELTHDGALAWARRQSPEPTRLRPFPYDAFEADAVAGGWAFTDDTRLYVVGRDGAFGTSWLRQETAETVLDGWLARRRHANRELALEDLGPWQQVAVRAVETGVTVADLADPRIASADDRDHADWLWISLRRSRIDPLRTLAASDNLMGEPQPSGRTGRRTHPCPLCDRPAPYAERYPRAVCDDCQARTVDRDGRSVHGRNLDLSGGFEARFTAPLPGEPPDAEGDGGPCPEVTRSGTCWVDGRECSMGEARFGGIVVQAVA